MLTPYQDALGGWIVCDGTTKYRFSTQAEAEQMSQKLDMAKAVIRAIQSLAPAADNAADLSAEYFDAGTIVDADLEPLGIDAATLISCITLLEQVHNLMTGVATYPAGYRTTLNKVRRVSA